MFHVYPINDEQEHELEGACCPCQPEVDWELVIVTHNAFDGRECVEQAEEIKNNTKL